MDESRRTIAARMTTTVVSFTNSLYLDVTFEAQVTILFRLCQKQMIGSHELRR